MLGYEAYFSGNFDHSIIDNKENKSFLPAAKANPENAGSIQKINTALKAIGAKRNSIK